MEPILNIDQKSDQEIQNIFTKNNIALTPNEGRQIVQMLGRNPTLTEATIWGIQGSEHSSYKSSRNYLKKLPVTGENVLLGPSEDAGVVKFHEAKNGEVYGIVYSHESHNHPSQVVPYEGAATGVGGICRDIACMGARVIGCMDALRFGEIEKPLTKKIMSGVVSGVGGYGNPLGVPNLGGDCFFDKSFNENCLVNVVAIGVLNWKNLIHSFAPENAAEDGYEYILVGKPTDRSGFGGAAFASLNLEEEDREKNKGAVQEPNPFLERHLLASFYDLFEKLEKSGDISRIGFKDLGAGGILCATIELVAEQGMGAEVHLDDVHVAEENLPAAVISCAETQERFCFAVPPDLTDFFLKHFNETWDFPNVSAGAQASKIGKIVPGGRYKATYQGETVCDARALDITEGIVVDRPIEEPVRESEEANVGAITNCPEDFFKKLLSSENVSSLRPFTESYDQTVQGNTILTRDQAEAAVFTPLRDYDELSSEEKLLQATIAVAGPVRIGKFDPKKQGILSVVQSALKVACVGGQPLALTDCLNYGNPEIPEQMWEFSQGVEGLSEVAKYLEIPYVSGNVSLYNSTSSGSVSPSAIVSCLGKIPMGNAARKNAFQTPGNEIYVLGTLSENINGSEAARLLGFENDRNIPEVDMEEVKKLIKFLVDDSHGCHATSLVKEGGLASALFQMSARGKCGFEITENLSIENYVSEKPVVVVETQCSVSLQEQAKKHGIPCQKIGTVTDGNISFSGIGDFSKEEISGIFWGSLREKK